MRPIRIVHIGTYMNGGGGEHLLRTLSENVDPDVCSFDQSIIVGKQFFNQEFASTFSFPVNLGGTLAIQYAVRHTDVLLFWGPVRLGRYLWWQKPKVCIFGALSLLSRASLLLSNPFVDVVWAVSNRVAREVCYDYPHEVIYPAVNVRKLRTSVNRSQARKRFNFTEGDFVIGFVASLYENKRPLALGKAIELLPPRFKALIVGSGPLNEAVRAQAEQLEGRCRSHPYDENVRDCYPAMDVCCLPFDSRQEGFGIAALDALYAGVPLLITPFSDMPVILSQGRSALFLDESQLVESVVENCLRIESDPSLREVLINEGREVVERSFTPRILARNFETFISEIAQKKNLR